jgi:hypothetical protein
MSISSLDQVEWNLSTTLQHDSSSSIAIGSSLSVDNINDPIPSRPSAYPPLDYLLSNVQLFDNYPVVPPSPLVPSVPSLTSAPPSARYDRQGEFYGCPNDLISSASEGSD